MSLLIPRQPITVNPLLAQAVGLNEAIFLQQLQYWLVRSKHEHDGRRWVYNTFEEWQEQFPFWSLRTMQRIVSNLVKAKLVIVHKFNAQNWDQKNWYAINYEALKVVENKNASLTFPIPPSCRDLDTANMADSLTETTQRLLTEKKEVIKKQSPPKSVVLKPPFAGEEFISTLADFVEHRKEKKAPLTDRARKILYKQLSRYDEEEAIDLLEKAIANGWKGVVFNTNGNGHSAPSRSVKHGPEEPLFRPSPEDLMRACRVPTLEEAIEIINDSDWKPSK